jgi:hypothetical protein
VVESKICQSLPVHQALIPTIRKRKLLTTARFCDGLQNHSRSGLSWTTFKRITPLRGGKIPFRSTDLEKGVTILVNNIDFYLSEMSVSNWHGGGLTLQRVLGDGLDGIQLFAHVSRFAHEYPVIDRLRDRCINMFSPLEKEAVRSVIGCRPADWIKKNQWLRAWQGRQVAELIAGKFALKAPPLRALVCPQNVASLYAIEALTRIRPVDYISWVMDDHLVRWRDGVWRYPQGIETLFARHLRGAKRVFVISPTMAEFYADRFGIESQVLFGPADSIEFSASAGEIQRELRLGYFGALGDWQLDPLVALAEKLTACGAVLDIYSSKDTLPEQLSRPGVFLKPPIPAGEVTTTMRMYDAVVLPISFRTELRHMSEFNIATKMSECLACGSVTLAIGPDYAAMVKYLRVNGGAIVISDLTVENMIQTITTIRNVESRNTVIREARKIVDRELSTACMRTRWRGAFRNWECPSSKTM